MTIKKQCMHSEWALAYSFPSCSKKTENNSLEEYFKNLKIGAVLSYSDDSPKLIILGFVNSKNNASILVLCEREGLFSEKDGYQPWLIFEIKFEKGVFVHSNLGSYFEKDEADKEFCIRQGLEWTGSDYFDDYFR